MVSIQVCRLCSSTQNLLWVFDKQYTEDMPEIIKVTCGVEILKSDPVTQMVCNTCYQLTKKMYQFRNKSIKNDKDLKARHTASQLKHSSENSKQRQTNDVSNSVISSSSSSDKYKFAHPSIKEIIAKYPNIILPVNSLKSHVGAYITLSRDEVDEYYQEKGMTNEEIQRMKEGDVDYYSEKKQLIKKGKKRKNNGLISPQPSKSKNIRTSTDSSIGLKPTQASSENLNHTKNKKSPSIDSNGSTKNCSLDQSVKVLSDIRIIINENFNKTNISKLIKEMAKDKRNSNENFLDKPKEKLSEEGKEVVQEKSKEKSMEKPVSPLREILKNNDTTSSNVEKDTLFKSILLGDNNLKISKVSPQKDPLEVKEDTQYSSETSLLKEALKTNNNIENEKKPNESGTVTLLKERKASAGLPLHEINSNNRAVNRELLNSDADISSGTSTEKNSECSFLIDSDSHSSKSDSNHEANKNSFIKALQLIPKVADGASNSGSNMPDLSLVSVATKSYTLYTCKVCDSQHTSLKDLKVHSRKTHTKCPLCNKRFRTLLSRDEHVAKMCSVSKSLALTKNAKLVLKKVENDEEIREQYPNLIFNLEVPSPLELSASSKVSEAAADCTPRTVSDEASVTEPLPGIQETIAESEAATSAAIGELEKYLTQVEIVPERSSEKSVQSTPETMTQKGKDAEVICISDEESESQESSKTKGSSSTPKINVVNSEFLNEINLHDCDVDIFKRILLQAQNKPEKQRIEDLLKCRIEDSSTSRVKVFKDLRKFLHHYKIPVELYHSQTISAEIKSRKALSPKTKSGLWNNLKPEVLVPYTNPKAPKPASTAGSTVVANGHIGLKKQPTYTNPTIPVQITGKNVQSVVKQTLPQMSPVTSIQTTTVPTMNFIAFTPTPSNAYPHARPTLFLLPNSILPQSTVQRPQTSLAIQSTSAATMKTVQAKPSDTVVQQLGSITNALMSPTHTVGNAVIAVPSVVTNGIASASGTQVVKSGIRVKNLKELS